MKSTLTSAVTERSRPFSPAAILLHQDIGAPCRGEMNQPPPPLARVGMLYTRLRRAMSWGCQNGQDSPQALSKFPRSPRRSAAIGHENEDVMSTTANPQRARWCAWRSDSVLFPDKTDFPISLVTSRPATGADRRVVHFWRLAFLVALAVASLWISCSVAWRFCLGTGAGAPWAMR